MNKDFENLAGARILLTGHTGFTGSWASRWLCRIGAEVIGYSLEPETNPSLFNELGLAKDLEHHIGDVRDSENLKKVIKSSSPDLILHLAAQPLVRRSYRLSRETFDVNVMGTVNLLDAALEVDSIKGVLCITTDKVYKNNDSGVAFKETDEIGGSDPYSASKASAELAISSYRESFYSKRSVPLIAARGGNIIGGGDWSEDRLIPDFVRSWSNSTKLGVRFPAATRPWQHVLSLIDGYLSILSGALDEKSTQLSTAYNLGPDLSEVLSVADVLKVLERELTGVAVEFGESHLKEAQELQLDSSLAAKELGWWPAVSTEEAIRMTGRWYKAFYQGQSAMALCDDQIDFWQGTRKGGGQE
jgi:CDP-glucose 4,6-dehydratase